MKKIACLYFIITILAIATTKAQVQELEQLALDIEKLAQLKSILTNMYKGYEILTKGYNTVKDLTEGNFNLHKVFLDGLLEVSPTVKKYKTIAEIINGQKVLVKEYKTAFNYFKSINVFEEGEIEYLSQVYSSLFNRSLKNIDELLMVITSNQLRMNDAERLKIIDRIYDDMQDKLSFLHDFNGRMVVVVQQKKSALEEIKVLEKLHGVQH